MTRPHLNVRSRLTLWYAGSLALVLCAFALGTYGYVRASLSEQLTSRLDQSYALVEKTVREQPDEIIEIEAHGAVSAFRIDEGDWPRHSSGGWVAARLDDVAVTSGAAPWFGIGGNGRHYYLKQAIVTAGERRYRVAVAQDAEDTQIGLRRLGYTLLAGFPIALVLALGVGYVLAGRALAPIHTIVAKAREITTEKLSERMPVQNPYDEFGHLAGVFNETLARLQEGFERLRRFTADAAHELRTPLAVIRGVGEVGLQEANEPQKYREVIGSMLEETDRLTRLAEGLLTLARADSGQLHLSLQPISLATLLREVADCLRVLAEEKDQQLVCDRHHDAHAFVDRAVFRQALMNLVANAITYTPRGGRIEVGLITLPPDSVAIEVRDNGAGIARTHQDRIFDRFYRVDIGRSSTTGGAGLGLAITRWIVEQHGGTIGVVSEEGHGATFRITLATAPAVA